MTFNLSKRLKSQPLPDCPFTIALLVISSLISLTFALFFRLKNLINRIQKSFNQVTAKKIIKAFMLIKINRIIGDWTSFDNVQRQNTNSRTTILLLSTIMKQKHMVFFHSSIVEIDTTNFAFLFKSIRLKQASKIDIVFIYWMIMDIMFLEEIFFHKPKITEKALHLQLKEKNIVLNFLSYFLKKLQNDAKLLIG